MQTRAWWLVALLGVACDDGPEERAVAADAATVSVDGTLGCAPVDETCNGADDDCDNLIDEGTRNACGLCGAEPREVCNGADDDCDGAVDEAVLNACGGCGAAPQELCNGADDDCDGATDEGVKNACDGCGPVPPEVCNEADDDCDGEADEGGPQRVRRVRRDPRRGLQR